MNTITTTPYQQQQHPNTSPIQTLAILYKFYADFNHNDEDNHGTIFCIPDIQQQNFYEWWSNHILCYITKRNWMSGKAKHVKFHILNIERFYEFIQEEVMPIPEDDDNTDIKLKRIA